MWHSGSTWRELILLLKEGIISGSLVLVCNLLLMTVTAGKDLLLNYFVFENILILLNLLFV